jgi:acetoin:2,6-dichlorophenolindophenol oxidoreductase subunit alpha
VAVAFFGDGATNHGYFHECLNFARVRRLPVVFVCENNLYGEYSALEHTTPITRLADRAASYAMASERVDGNDVMAVFEAAERVFERARSGSGPTLVEAMTYRQAGHARTDPGTYRPAGELEAWLERDPILRSQRRLLESGVSQQELDRLGEEADAAVQEALRRAQDWPSAPAEARFEHVFA